MKEDRWDGDGEEFWQTQESYFKLKDTQMLAHPSTEASVLLVVVQ